MTEAELKIFLNGLQKGWAWIQVDKDLNLVHFEFISSYKYYHRVLKKRLINVFKGICLFLNLRKEFKFVNPLIKEGFLDIKGGFIFKMKITKNEKQKEWISDLCDGLKQDRMQKDSKTIKKVDNNSLEKRKYILKKLENTRLSNNEKKVFIAIYGENEKKDIKIIIDKIVKENFDIEQCIDFTMSKHR